jgi:TolB-like protein/DNA-binding winged helix-turn-helix (wHTH) protein
MGTYRFGDFELDLDAMQLFSNGESVKLERRPLDLLILLLSRHGALVTRDEIIAALWPRGTVIDFDAGINTLVRKVRGALREPSDGLQYIETVPGRGYRFSVPTTLSAQPAAPDVAIVGRTPTENSRVRARAMVLAVSVALLLAAAVTVLIWQASREPALMRIAVLPFDNLTGDDGLEYLAWGLAEDARDSLAQIDSPELRLVGGFSARAAVDSTVPVSQIGRELNADLLLLGALSGEGTRIRLTPRLIRVADDEVIWTKSFDRELTNVLGLQRELAIGIAEQVRLQLSPEVAAAITRRQTQNPNAYALYLKGRHAWNRLSRPSVREALGYFQQAADEDPTYALAWAGIAHTLVTSPLTSGTRRTDVESRASQAMERALRYGPDLAEVQYALGYFRNLVEWDAVGAQQAARRAVQLDPDNPMARMFLGVLLFQSGNPAEALGSLRRARELDPQFTLAFANSALITANAGDPEAGLELARQAVAMGPEVWAAHYQLGNVQMRLGNYAAALDAYTIAERYSGGNSQADFRAMALVGLGRESEARALLADMRARAEREYVSPLDLARVYTALGETDDAFYWLDRALESRENGMHSFELNVPFESLHADPRFASLLRRRDLAALTRRSAYE